MVIRRQSAVGAIAPCTSNGRCEESVHGFDKAIGKTGSEVFENSFQVVFDGLAHD